MTLTSWVIGITAPTTWRSCRTVPTPRSGCGRRTASTVASSSRCRDNRPQHGRFGSLGLKTPLFRAHADKLSAHPQDRGIPVKSGVIEATGARVTKRGAPLAVLIVAATFAG